jgi:hypothetical protein
VRTLDDTCPRLLCRRHAYEPFFTDALAIYLLNLFLAFLQPKFDPSMQQDLAAEDVEEGAPGLPGANTGSSQKGGK